MRCATKVASQLITPSLKHHHCRPATGAAGVDVTMAFLGAHNARMPLWILWNAPATNVAKNAVVRMLAATTTASPVTHATPLVRHMVSIISLPTWHVVLFCYVSLVHNVQLLHSFVSCSVAIESGRAS